MHKCDRALGLLDKRANRLMVGQLSTPDDHRHGPSKAGPLGGRALEDSCKEQPAGQPSQYCNLTTSQLSHWYIQAASALMGGQTHPIGVEGLPAAVTRSTRAPTHGHGLQARPGELQ